MIQREKHSLVYLMLQLWRQIVWISSSDMNLYEFSMITRQRGIEGIIFEDYHFGLKRKNKNGSKIWMYANKLSKASIRTQESSIVTTTSIKADGIHDYAHPPKMSFNVYARVQSIEKWKNSNVTMVMLMQFPYSIVQKQSNHSGSKININWFWNGSLQRVLEKLSSDEYHRMPISLRATRLATNKEERLDSTFEEWGSTSPNSEHTVIAIITTRNDIVFCYIIEEISGVLNLRFLKLTDYILRTYISNAIFPPSFSQMILISLSNLP